jgi:hypothetical protein
LPRRDITVNDLLDIEAVDNHWFERFGFLPA